MPKEKSCESKWEGLSGGIVFVCSYLLPLASCKLASIRWRVGASGKTNAHSLGGKALLVHHRLLLGLVPVVMSQMRFSSSGGKVRNPHKRSSRRSRPRWGLFKNSGAGRSARATPVRGGELLCARRNVPPLRCMGSLVWECGDPWGQPLLLHAIAETVSRLVFLRLGPAARSSSEHAVRGVDVHPELG